ncbi:MAG TPA: peptidoglycan DD-metalloendopeptidase family protein [Nitriliruptoraceae bacterium]|nr:peptidoglycan DD-metalloendopeptidase family protein [Nitriliruptoraceae bacterium]
MAQDRDDLAQARARIDALEDQLDAAVAEAGGAELDLEDAEHRLAAIEAVVNQVAQRVDEQRQAVRDAENELEALHEQQEQARQAVQRRAVQLYKTGSAGGVFALLQATDIQAAIERSELLTLLDADDQAILETLASSAGRTEAAQEVLAAEAAVLDGLLEEQTEIMATAEELRDSRALAAAAAAAEVDRVEEAHDEAEDEATRLEEVIRKAEAEAAARAEAARQEAERAAAARAAAQRTADTADTSGSSSPANGTSDSSPASGSTSATPAADPPPAPSGGGYVWPACGSVTSEYGWRWGRPHKGLDIDDNVSSAIYAAQSGTVISAGWNSGGYGNLTLIKHGDGVVTAYAHQASIHVSTGQTVSRGQQIGIIGTTGHSTGTHLHFETRVGGGAVNPRNFLSGGC